MSRSLAYYEKFATKLILSYFKKYKISGQFSDDMVGYVINRMVIADGRYSYDKIKESIKKVKTPEECRSHYLRMHGIYGIRSYMDMQKSKNNRKIKTVSLPDFDLPSNKNNALTELINKEDDIYSSARATVLLHSCNLTDNEKNVLQKYLIDGLTFRQIAKLNGYSPQAAYYAYKNGLKKITSALKPYEPPSFLPHKACTS